MEPIVSIIIPIYNAEKFILDTIACVKAQDFSDWEMLLIDDSSTDSTRKILDDYTAQQMDERLRVYTIENKGAAVARNFGLKEAKGRYITYLDADDLWEKNKLSKQLKFMQEKDAAFTFTSYEFADENGVGLGKIVRVPETIVYKEALQNTTIFTSTVMFDTEKLPKSELEMPRVKSEDSALWFRILRSGITAYGLDENLVKYRRSPGTLSSNKIEAIKRIWNLYRKEEKLSIPYSLYNLFFWAVRATKRRL